MDEVRPNGRAPQAKFNPARALVLGFLIAIATGTVLLSLPVSHQAGQEITFLDALFTATSAVCVTGLVVVDTGTAWSPFGQVVIALLIQIGGFGIMTGAVLVAVMLGKRITLHERLAVQQQLGQSNPAGMVRLVRQIALMIVVIELAGMALLFVRWLPDYSASQAAFMAFFHSISAFNNAGFDLFGNSLMNYANDAFVNLVVILLVAAGGLGFLVLTDLYGWTGSVNRGERYRLSLHARLTLTVTGVLLLVTYLSVLILEFSNPATLGELGMRGKLLAPLFHAASSRTAGFVTVDVGEFLPATLLITMIMMFVGGSPASTAGGMKTTTLGVLLLTARAILRGSRDVNAAERRLPPGIVDKALAVLILFSSLLGLVTFGLLITEGSAFLPTLFEATSAVGTVGMSMGLTAELSPLGRIIVIIAMFAGRLGPLTLVVSLAGRQAALDHPVRYAEEKVMIG